MNENYYLRTTCRLCNSTKLLTVLPLTPTALCDAYIKTEKSQEVYPLDLLQCADCGFVQINCIVNPEIIYRDYIYVTTSSTGLNKHFEGYAREVSNYLKLSSNHFAVDIGSNDGTLLSHFKPKVKQVLGIEPSVKTAADATARGIETLPEFFDLSLAKNIREKYHPADLITINNLFANIDDLAGFAEGLEHLLSPEGVLVIESSYLGDMVDNMVFDFIYHEHLSYFSILPLVKFFRRYGLRLIHLQHVGTKGGSFRYYWARENSKHVASPDVVKFSNSERSKQMDAGYFKNFSIRISAVKEKLIEILEQNEGKTIVGYGASATSTTLIYHFGLQEYLKYLIDDNPGKIGTLSPGLHIPVKSLQDSELNSDTLLVIIAWRYANEIIEKVKRFNPAIVIPLPEIKKV
jgi:hypothetical protein